MVGNMGLGISKIPSFQGNMLIVRRKGDDWSQIYSQLTVYFSEEQLRV
jgi:hypothetical protein